MKTLIILIIIVSFNSTIIAQNRDEARLKKIIDSLENIVFDNNAKIDSLKDNNTKIEIEIKEYSNEQNSILTDEQIGETFICISNTVIYDKPGIGESKSIGNLKNGDRVKVTEMLDEYSYKINYNGFVGYVFKTGLKNENEKRQLEEKRIEERKQLEEKRIEERKQLEEQEFLAKQQRAKELIEKYGKSDGMKIFDGLIWIGMTKEMVIESWGVPGDINRTVTEYGVHEQMIYGKKYVYIENGILTSWQD